jgi:hypothetical protein
MLLRVKFKPHTLQFFVLHRCLEVMHCDCVADFLKLCQELIRSYESDARACPFVGADAWAIPDNQATSGLHVVAG